MIPSQTLAGRPFVKMHGARNHFVIVDAREQPFAPDRDDIVHICDPTVGVGADELIVMEPAANGGDVFMRIYNGDGREVEACGNALRCVAWLLMTEHGSDGAVVETLAGLLSCERAGDRLVRASMGTVSMDWRTIPLSREVDTLHLSTGADDLGDGAAVNVGNPHVVFFVDDLDGVDVARAAGRIQVDDLFPNSVNVEVAQMLAPDRMRVVVYERGAGLTMACGSGACAAAFAARQRGLMRGDTMRVELPGGLVEVELVDDEAFLTGPVAYAFSGVF